MLVLHQRYVQGGDKPWRVVSNGGDRRELVEVMRMMHEAAEQGYTMAQRSLGAVYSHGVGVNQGYATAVKYYRKAADQRVTVAQLNIGIMYDHGQGVPVEYSIVMKWCRKAAEQGAAEAAMKWYGMATDQGDEEAAVNAAAVAEDASLEKRKPKTARMLALVSCLFLFLFISFFFPLSPALEVTTSY